MGQNYFLTRTNIRRNRHPHFTNFFSTPARRVKRAEARKAKLRSAEQSGVPYGTLKPAVNCCSRRHNIRSRKGKGFSKQELLEAGIKSKHFVKSIKISFDAKRKTCHPSNVQTLKDYLARVVVSSKDLKNPCLQGYPQIIANSKEASGELPTTRNLFSLSKDFVAEKNQSLSPSAPVQYHPITEQLSKFDTNAETKKQFKAKHFKNRNKYVKPEVKGKKDQKAAGGKKKAAKK
ncbi:MAG: 60S ribosomal protein L13 [Marteilia pararefringens]